MTHGSLFSGIGGFDLAAEWMGWNNIFHCEWNPFGQKILKYYWPKAISYEDITKTDFSIHRGTIDILTGGFPCQPYSVAGLRKGKEDNRHLWPEMLRAIREIKPRWVVGENVPGLTNWNDGMVFNEVQSDLEAEGYEVRAFILPAASLNAPHKRERVWFVAYAPSERCNRWAPSSDWKNKSEQERCEMDGEITGFSSLRTIADTYNNGSHAAENRQGDSTGNDRGKTRENTIEQFTGCGSETAGTCYVTNADEQHGNISGFCTGWLSQQQKAGIFNDRVAGNDEHTDGKRCQKFDNAEKPKEQTFYSWEHPSDWNNWPTQPPICVGDDGVSARLDGITFPKWRTESIKGGGNAIVPEVVYQIFKAIKRYEEVYS